MQVRSTILWTLAAACLLSVGTAGASVHALQIGWSELRPADQVDPVPGTPLPDPDSAEGEALSWNLQDKTVEMTGYALPVDREGELVYEFMLVPFTGICAHVAPPPANQVVLVTPERPYKLSEIYEPVSVTGTLKPGLEKTQLFILDGVTVIESGYSVGRAQVNRAGNAEKAAPRPKTPWTFLKQ